MEHPAKKIKFLLNHYHLGVRELSEKLGVTMECLHEILDEKEIPTLNFLYRIISLFNLKEDFFGEHIRPPSSRHHGAPEGRPAPQPAPAPSSPATTQELADLQLFPGKEVRRRRSPGGRGHASRKLDLAEVAARQKAMLDLLISKKVFSIQEYENRIEILRARVMARKMEGERSR